MTMLRQCGGVWRCGNFELAWADCRLQIAAIPSTSVKHPFAPHTSLAVEPKGIAALPSAAVARLALLLILLGNSAKGVVLTSYVQSVLPSCINVRNTSSRQCLAAYSHHSGLSL